MRSETALRLTAPIRAYLRVSPLQRGKGFIIRRLLLPLLPPPPAAFAASVPGGGRVELFYRETLGYVTLIEGGFERAELEAAREAARPGSTAIDVGANVGLFSVTIASVLGPSGSVIAVEPDAANVRRLRANLELNQIGNALVVEAAATRDGGSITLNVAADPAYHSIGRVANAGPTSAVASVRAVRLDDVWLKNGGGEVSFIKVDVEGAEVGVLEGARRILEAHHPVLLLEAGTEAELGALRNVLEPLGYRRDQRPGFMAWNHLFQWTPPR